MRPDLFSGPAQRDDSHRILARLANGGNPPPVARQWNGWNTLQRAHMAAVVALLAAVAAAWVWLQDVGAPAQRRPPLAPIATVRAPAAAAPQAATIVNEPAQAAPSVSQPPFVRAARPPDPRVMRPHLAKPPAPVRAQRREAPSEGDEDVTLLAAMLRHANGQKAASSPPND